MFNKPSIIAFTLAVIASAFMYANMFTSFTDAFGLRAEAQAVKEGLVSYWTFDQADIKGKTVKDVWGDNDGTIIGPKIVKGKVGEALEFDGVDDYVLVDHDGSLTFGSGDFSVDLWANPTTMGSYTGLITTDIAGDQAWKIFRDVPGGGGYFRARYGSTQSDYPPVSAGDWHHYGYVKSKTTLTLYLDGEFVVSDACPATHSLVGTELAFGSYRIQNAKDGLYIYNGLIDETRLYDRALSEDEVKKNFVAKGFSAVNPTKKLALTWGKLKASK